MLRCAAADGDVECLGDIEYRGWEKLLSTDGLRTKPPVSGSTPGMIAGDAVREDARNDSAAGWEIVLPEVLAL